MADAQAPARRIDGKAFAERLRARVAAAAGRLESRHGVKPGLAVVIVGEDPASQIYVRNKGEQTAAAGMRSDTHRLAEATTQDELLDLIAQLNADPGIHGVLVQMPLPSHIDAAAVLASRDAVASHVDEEVAGELLLGVGIGAVEHIGLAGAAAHDGAVLAGLQPFAAS
ncbi:MAG: tetrahydrofolate dehydrogenase/cyclohydrolase catalytic domain-containing protein, partial [Brevundimonas sp.]